MIQKLKELSQQQTPTLCFNTAQRTRSILGGLLIRHDSNKSKDVSCQNRRVSYILIIKQLTTIVSAKNGEQILPATGISHLKLSCLPFKLKFQQRLLHSQILDFRMFNFYTFTRRRLAIIRLHGCNFSFCFEHMRDCGFYTTSQQLNMLILFKEHWELKFLFPLGGYQFRFACLLFDETCDEWIK